MSVDFYEEQFAPQKPPSIDSTGDEQADILSRRATQIGEWLGGGWISNLIDGALEFVEKGLETLERIVNQIIEIFNNVVVTPINSAIQKIKDWWNGIWAPGEGGHAERQKNAIDFNSEEVIKAMDEAKAAAQVAANAEEKGKMLDKDLAAQVTEVGTRAKESEVPKDTPGWQSLNPMEDVSFPRSDLEPRPRIARSNRTSQDNNGNPHSHAVNIEWVDPTYTPPAGEFGVVYIKATRKRIYNTVTFALGPKPASETNSLRPTVYKMQKTDGVPNGQLVMVAGTPEGGGMTVPTIPDISTDATWGFPDIEAEPGDWFAVIFAQGGTVTRPLFCKTTANIAARAGINPSRLSATIPGLTFFNPYIEADWPDWTTLVVPWVALGQKTALAPASYNDLFDRANSNTPGPNWAVYGIGLTLWSTAIESRRVTYGGLKSRQDHTTAVYALPTTTKSQSVMMRTKTWENYDKGNNTIRDMPYKDVIWLRGNADLTVGVAAFIFQKRVEIWGFNAANPRITAEHPINEDSPALLGGIWMAGINHPNTENAEWFLHAAGNGYVLYKNGETTEHSVLNASDNTQEFKTGDNDKYGGMSVYAYSRGDLAPGWRGTYISAPIDEFRLRDL